MNLSELKSMEFVALKHLAQQNGINAKFQTKNNIIMALHREPHEEHKQPPNSLGSIERTGINIQKLRHALEYGMSEPEEEDPLLHMSETGRSVMTQLPPVPWEGAVKISDFMPRNKERSHLEAAVNANRGDAVASFLRSRQPRAWSVIDRAVAGCLAGRVEARVIGSLVRSDLSLIPVIDGALMKAIESSNVFATRTFLGVLLGIENGASCDRKKLLAVAIRQGNRTIVETVLELFHLFDCRYDIIADLADMWREPEIIDGVIGLNATSLNAGALDLLRSQLVTFYSTPSINETLRHAIERGNPDIKILKLVLSLEWPNDVSIENHVSMAVKSRDCRVLNLLLEHGQSVSCADVAYAVEKRRIQTLDMLATYLALNCRERFANSADAWDVMFTLAHGGTQMYRAGENCWLLMKKLFDYVDHSEYERDDDVVASLKKTTRTEAYSQEYSMKLEVVRNRMTKQVLSEDLFFPRDLCLLIYDFLYQDDGTKFEA